MTQHQANYDTIVSLRATADALDTEIKGTLSLLTDTRKELLTATPIGSKSSNGSEKPLRQLEYAELLSYAQRIARFTVPPADQRTPKQVVGNGMTTAEAGGPSQDVKVQVQSPGSRLEPPPALQQINTPVQTPAAAPTTPGPSASVSHFQAADSSRAIDALPEHLRRWLDPATSRAQFTPWPDQDAIRRGALARIQGMLENGQDPTTAHINGVAEEVVPEQQQNGQVEAPADRTRDRRTAVASQGPGRQRQESLDDGGIGFDLYEPDEE